MSDEERFRIGIDLGGTKTEAIVIDDVGSERLRKRVDTPCNDYDAIIDTIVELVRDVERSIAMRCSVGIGMPGSISRATGMIKNANTTCLIGRAFDRDLELALGRPVRVANDANCFALSEAIDGAGATVDNVFAVIMGTGTGGGIVIDRKVIEGDNRIAGEWGHNPLPWPSEDERPGPACYCGKHGCIETFVSGPGLAADHARRVPGSWTAEAVARAAASGDADASASLQRHHDRLARGLACVINVLDPGVIVLGGGLSQMPSLYEIVPRLWGKYVFSDEVSTRLLPAKHGDSSGVRGAAWLWGGP